MAGSIKLGTRHGGTYCFINSAYQRLAGHATSLETDRKHLNTGVYVNAEAAHIIHKSAHTCIPAHRQMRATALQQSMRREPHERGPSPRGANDINRCMVTDDGLLSSAVSPHNI